MTLYRNKKYNESIVVLNNAKNAKEAERVYYLGLNYYNLKEADNAYEFFEKGKNSGDKTLGSSSAFYMGLIKFGTLEYEAAKPHFEWVLDHSQDPSLDDQAEGYIEKIAGILFFAEQAKTKFFLDITTGLTYDSNVLSTADSTIDAGTATNVGGGRFLGIVDGKYRPIYNKHHEFSIDADVTYYYSFNSVHVSADPTIFTFDFPYVHKRILFGKGYQTTISPQYRSLYLDSTSSGTREEILTVMAIDWENTFVMKPTWFSAYNFRVASGDSTLSSSIGANDLDTTLIKFESSQTLFLNKAKDNILVLDFGFRNNGAKGSDQKYFRYDLAATYIRPSFLETSWTSSLKYYNANYGSHSSGRADSNYVLGTGLSKTLSKKYSTAVTAEYTKNSSSVDSSSYTKWTVLTTFSAKYSF